MSAMIRFVFFISNNRQDKEYNGWGLPWCEHSGNYCANSRGLWPGYKLGDPGATCGPWGKARACLREVARVGGRREGGDSRRRAGKGRGSPPQGAVPVPAALEVYSTTPMHLCKRAAPSRGEERSPF